MQRMLIAGGRVVLPTGKEAAEMLIEKGKIAPIGESEKST